MTLNEAKLRAIEAFGSLDRVAFCRTGMPTNGQRDQKAQIGVCYIPFEGAQAYAKVSQLTGDPLHATTVKITAELADLNDWGYFSPRPQDWDLLV